MSDDKSGGAIVQFESAQAARRPVAGIAVAARIVAGLSQAGFERAWLILPAGEALGASAETDIARLAGAMNVTICEASPPEAATATRVPSDRLGDPARMAVDPEAGIRLDRPGAAAAILRQTGKMSDGPISRWLNRPVSRLISTWLLHLPGLRPIHATAVNALIAVIMFAILLGGGGSGVAAAGLLFQLASILDGVDGEVARATFRTSPAGATIDSAVDAATSLMLVAGLTFNLHWRGDPWALGLGAWGLGLYLIGLFIVRRGVPSHDSFTLDHLKDDYAGLSGRFVPSLMRFLTVVSSRDFFALLFCVLMVAGLEILVLAIFAAAASIWIHFVLGTVSRARELAAQSPAR